MVDIPKFQGGSSGSSGSSSSSGASSSGGSSGGTASKPKPNPNLKIAFENMLAVFGMPLTSNLRKLIDRAIKEGWSSTTFIFHLRRTPEYARAFPGNLNPDGTVNLPESSYQSRKQSYQDAAAQIGVNLGPKLLSDLVQKDISPSLFAARAKAVQTVRQNKTVFEQFKEYAIANDIASPKELDKKGLLRFALGLGPKEWYDLYRGAYVSAQIENAGISVGQGEQIGFRALDRLLNHAAPGLDPTRVNWGELATLVREVLPISKLYEAGITGRQLVKMELGGPEAPAIAERVKQVLATYRAAFEQPAEPQLTPGGLLVGSPQQQATE